MKYCEEISEQFDIRAHYRFCDFEEAETSTDGYSCLDIFGKDINNLFLEDASTIAVL